MKLEPYPLLMQPFLRTLVWGGDRLARYGKQVAAGAKVGESWDISGHREGLSRVADGQLAGKAIPELTAEFGAALVWDSGGIPGTVTGDSGDSYRLKQLNVGGKGK